MTLVKGTIPKILKRNAYDLIMYGYVKGMQDNFPTISIDKALVNFAERFNIVKEFNLESARSAYERMNREHRDYGKTSN